MGWINPNGGFLVLQQIDKIFLRMESGLHSTDKLWINQDLGDGAGWFLLGKQYVKGNATYGFSPFCCYATVATVATFSQRYCLGLWNAFIVKIGILAQSLVLGIIIPPMAGLSIVMSAEVTVWEELGWPAKAALH